MENVRTSSDSATSHHQSQWLQRMLSDSESKMKAMVTLIEDDDSLSTRNDDIYQKRKAELKQMLEGFNMSYRSLAEKYDQLKSQIENVVVSETFQHTSNNNMSISGSSDNHKSEISLFQPDDESDDGVDRGFEYLSRLADQLLSADRHNPKYEYQDSQTDEQIMNFMDNRHSTLPELSLQVTKLLEENIRQQAELLRRNKEKRETISELRSQLECTKPVNRLSQNPFGRIKTEGKYNKLRRFFSCSPSDTL